MRTTPTFVALHRVGGHGRSAARRGVDDATTTTLAQRLDPLLRPHGDAAEVDRDDLEDPLELRLGPDRLATDEALLLWTMSRPPNVDSAAANIVLTS